MWAASRQSAKAFAWADALLKVWLHIAEGKEYVTISNPNEWINHRHRENLDLFRAEAAVLMPIPQSDAEYRALHKKINTEILF
jgi:hypothetical protein